MKKAKLFMDTVVEIQVAIIETTLQEEAEAKVNRAFDAFRKVEQACSRFSPESELMTVCLGVMDSPVQISPFLFEPLKFALKVAKLTDGEFDPTIGKLMENQGYNFHYLTGALMETPSAASATFRDIILDEHNHTLFLNKPLVIDLGAVAKGFAIDLAANELKDFDGFMINAGGDLFAGGLDHGQPWKVGIQHPEKKEQTIDVIEISNEAVCTSGSYERRNSKSPGMHHIINPKTERSPNEWVSTSVVAPFAMMADAFSTTAFLLSHEKEKKFIEDAGLKGLFISSDLQIIKVGGI